MEAFYCTKCGWALPLGATLPTTCSACGCFTKWTEVAPTDPTTTYALSVNDRKFLKARGIATAPDETSRSARSQSSG